MKSYGYSGLIFKLLSTSYLSTSVLGQEYMKWTSCPGGFLGLFGGNLPDMENFDRDKYLKGKWYEYKREAETDSEVEFSCVSYDTVINVADGTSDFVINQEEVNKDGLK